MVDWAKRFFGTLVVLAAVTFSVTAWAVSRVGCAHQKIMVS